LAVDRQHSGFWNAGSVRAAVGSYSITTNRMRATGSESAAVKARDASFRISAEHAGKGSRLVSGIDFVTRFGLRASDSVRDADRHDLGAYATWSTQAARQLQWSAGARADRVISQNRGGFFGDRSRKDVALSGHGAVTAGPFHGVAATLQVASGYREPTLSDRYFRGVSGRGFITGNPELEPERSMQIDGSVRWSGTQSRVALFAYR
jgi:outer membrane receptor protein involved in Fe transport